MCFVTDARSSLVKSFFDNSALSSEVLLISSRDANQSRHLVVAKIKIKAFFHLKTLDSLEYISIAANLALKEPWPLFTLEPTRPICPTKLRLRREREKKKERKIVPAAAARASATICMTKGGNCRPALYIHSSSSSAIILNGECI